MFQAGQDKDPSPDSLLWLTIRCHWYRTVTGTGMIVRRSRSLEATCKWGVGPIIGQTSDLLQSPVRPAQGFWQGNYTWLVLDPKESQCDSKGEREEIDISIFQVLLEEFIKINLHEVQNKQTAALSPNRDVMVRM